MKQETVTVLFAVRHTTKHVYCCMSQYSTHHIITKVKHLLKLRNNTHTAPLRTNKTLNAKKDK